MALTKSEQETIKQLYTVDKLSQKEIHELTGYAYETIVKYMGKTRGREVITSRERKEIIRLYTVERLGLNAIGRKLKRNYKPIRETLQKAHIPIRKGVGTIGRGPDNSHWAGGRTQTSDGYIRLWLDESDPLYSMTRAGDGYALEHRVVMARKLGRPLTKSETVHHVNGNRADNRLSNLQLRQSQHGAGQVWTCAECNSTNIIARKLK